MLDLDAIARYPLLTCVSGFAGRSQLDAAFNARGLKPKVVFTAADADVITTYGRLGLGVGIPARMAYDPVHHGDLAPLHAGHLFKPSITKIGFRRGTYLRAYIYDFIALFAAHLKLKPVDQAAHAPDQAAVDSRRR